MRNKKQAFLPGLERLNQSTTHGGDLAIGKRKRRRPISIRKSMHIVLRSDVAKGFLSLRNLRHRPICEKYIQHFARKFRVRVYRYSINSNHIHILLLVKRREHLQHFLRALAGTIARKIKNKGTFWSYLAFSRVVEWGRAFKLAQNYIQKNVLEASGVIRYTPRLI